MRQGCSESLSSILSLKKFMNLRKKNFTATTKQIYIQHLLNSSLLVISMFLCSIRWNYTGDDRSYQKHPQSNPATKAPVAVKLGRVREKLLLFRYDTQTGARTWYCIFLLTVQQKTASSEVPNNKVTSTCEIGRYITHKERFILTHHPSPGGSHSIKD